MKKLITILLLLILSLSSEAKKRALIIAIGDYPTNSGWGKISSVNDVQIIKQTLINQQFLEQDLQILINEQATKQGIISAIEALLNKSMPGDIIIIHYSGHGQQIFDDNEDESDGKDEALIPYDAFAKYTDRYKGENHIRDDELNRIIANFRNKLGANGQLLFLLDSCHSGSSTRGAKARGGNGIFAPADWKQPESGASTTGSAILEIVKLNPQAAPFIIISGASADELNYEYQDYGSLSYSFAKAMNELGADFTFRQLFSSILANMNVITPQQTPTIEGDIDFKLFKGEYIKQQPYFEIKSSNKENLLTINGGKIQGIFNNTTVLLLPAGTTKVTKDKVICKGIITKAEFNQSDVKLDKPIADFNNKKYWVFIDQYSYGDMNVNVFFSSEVTDAPLIDGIKTFLVKNNLGTIKEDSLKSDIIIEKNNDAYILNTAKGKEVFDVVKSVGATEDIQSISSKLFQFAQGQYLKNLSMKNLDYEFSIKLLPVEYDIMKRTIGEIKKEQLKINEGGVLAIREDVDYVVFQITNKSTKNLYFSVIEINSKGEISPFMPNDNCTMNDNERMIAPGKTVTYKTCVFVFSPPYERLMLKAFATIEPINFQPTVSTRGSEMRGNANPLEKFIQRSYIQSRGSKGIEISENVNSSDKVDGFSTEFVYEIIKK